MEDSPNLPDPTMEEANTNSSAGRMKVLRAKRKEEDETKFLESERERQKELRAKKKQSMTDKQKEEKRIYDRDRQRALRAKKKEKSLEVAPTAISPYNCKQTLSKAVLKGVRALPNSPNKRKAVVQGIARRFSVDLSEKMESNMNKSINEVNQKVVEFYFRPDIVYTCPGAKDYVTDWKDGQKIKLQKNFMTMFLREAFQVFKELNKDIQIGFSTFCSLRPKNVLLMKDTPSDQCKCIIHENFILKLKALKTPYDHSFWNKVLCDTNSSSCCWRNTCEKCSDGKSIPLPSDPRAQVTWKEWKKIEGKIAVRFHEECAGDLHDKLIADFPKMLGHVNIKRIQHEEFDSDKNNPQKRVLQIDFAMSFSCEYQNEVQSALWSRTSVMLFTAALFQGGKCKTFLICSDASTKDKDCIYAFINFLYEEFGDKTFYEEIIWSDGPSSEFKNKFMVKLIQILSKKFKRPFTWKYFATSHGKGVVDGVGGNAKRLVRMKMMAQKSDDVIQCAKDFASAAAEVCSSTQIYYIAKEHIDEVIARDNPWEHVNPFPGISRMHILICEGNTVLGKVHAQEVEAPSYATGELTVGQWVLVKYDGQLYPGEIIEVPDSENVNVSVMAPTGPPGHYKWPTPADSIWYARADVVKKISPPIVVNNRGEFKFPLDEVNN